MGYFNGISWGYLWDLMRCIGFFHGILMGFVVSDLADCWLSARHGWTVPVFDLWPHEGSEKNQQILDIQQTSLWYITISLDSARSSSNSTFSIRFFPFFFGPTMARPTLFQPRGRHTWSQHLPRADKIPPFCPRSDSWDFETLRPAQRCSEFRP